MEQKNVEVLLDSVREIVVRSGKKIFFQETISKKNEKDEWEVVGEPNEIMIRIDPLVHSYGRKLRIIFKMKDGKKVFYRGNGNCSNLPVSAQKNYIKGYWKTKTSMKNALRALRGSKKVRSKNKEKESENQE